MLGFAISLILVHVVNRQSFHWGMALAHAVARARRAGSVARALATLTARASARTATEHRRRARRARRLVIDRDARAGCCCCRSRSPSRGARADVGYPDVQQGAALRFPVDEGAHPSFRSEWWYVTGWLRDADGATSSAFS